MRKSMLDRLIRRNSTIQASLGGAFFYRDNTQKSPPIKIGWDKYFSFMKEYCECLNKQSDVFEKDQLYEYNKEESSLRFTFVFTFVASDTKITEHEIELILPVIRESIFNTLQLESKEAIACVCVGKANSRVILDYTFPSIRVNKEHFNKSIRKVFCDRIGKVGVRKELPEFKGGDWEDILLPMTDLSPMYGCKISKDDPTVSFVGLWSSIDNKIGDDIHESFTAKRHALFLTHCRKEINEIDEEECDYTPVILSSRFYPGITMAKIEEHSSKFSFNTDISSSSDADMIYHLLPLISKERLENSMYRWQVGRCIYNIFPKDPNGLDLFNTYCPGTRAENAKWWKDYESDRGANDFLSIKTVGYFARIDSPDSYDEWHTAWMQESVNQSLDKIELNVAEVMYRLLWLDFLTVGKNDWYHFHPGATKLTRCISNVDFTRRFDDMIRFYAKTQMDNSARIASVGITITSDATKSSAEQQKAIAEITRKLGTRTYQRAIESHCFTKFYRNKVEEFFNNNPALMAWSNIITEVHEDKVYTRPGKMEDFITMNSDIDYDENEYDWDSPIVKELMYWFRSAFIGEGLVDYFLKICASFLYGRNEEKSFYAFCGPLGDNSKSMVQSLLQKVMSVYAVDFPVCVLTDSRQSSSGPSPEIAQSKGAHIAFIAEPDGGIPFMGSLIKRYSGNDRIFARKLHENGDSFNQTFKMVLTCNAVPPIEGADDAVERRLVILPFMTKYCDDAPEDEEERFKQKRFPKDLSFEKKLEGFRRPMLWIIVNSFEKYMKEGLKKEDRPEAVQEYTRKYWEKNDPYKLFMVENLLKTDNAGDKVKVTDVFKIFNMWFKMTQNTKRSGVPDIITMTQHLSSPNFMGEPVNRIWSGWRFNKSEGSDDKPDRSKPKHNID